MARFVCSTPPLGARQRRELGGGCETWRDICWRPQSSASWWLGDLGVVREAASWCAYGRARWWVVDWTVGGLGLASWWLRTCVARCWTVGGLGHARWWVSRPVGGLWTGQLVAYGRHGFSGWGFVDGRSHPANRSRDSKIIWLGCRPPALPHIRKSRDSKHFFLFLFSGVVSRPPRPVGGPSPGSDGGPPGAGLPIKRTVGGLAMGL